MNRLDTLLVLRDGETFLALDARGEATAFNGHVDLGTGIRTALAQIVAEELSIRVDQVEMVLGSTQIGPDQGATIASETIQVSAIPLRQAAATARAFLLGLAAERLGVPTAGLTVIDGVVQSTQDRNLFIPYSALLAGQCARLDLDPHAPLKPVADYTIVGQPQPRVDLPAKATGVWTYVHDVRLPGMLHGRVIRPPYAGFDSGPHVGTSLIAVDKTSVAEVPGLVAVVVIGDFVGVVAEREENAVLAMNRLAVSWRPAPTMPDLNDPVTALRANPSTPRRLADRGDIALALDGVTQRMDRFYVWPYQMHASIGPSCAVADYRDGDLTVWSGTQNPFEVQNDLALLLDLPKDRITVERFEAAGCYGRNCADDVTADAALLSRAVGRPVRAQLTRQQEHAWEPKGAAQVMDVRGGLDSEGGPVGYDFETRYPSNVSTTLALLLTGAVPPVPVTADMGDRTALPPYAYGNLRVTVHDMPPIARASWFRGVSALPNSFAHESFIDELATAAKVDPIEYRLRYLTDPRAVDLVRAVAERANWVPHTKPGSLGGDGDILYGRGFAYAVYVHGPFPGTAAAWAAWVADVAVNKRTGEIAVTRVTVGQDSGQIVNPEGVRHQIHGNVLQSTSRVIKEVVEFSPTAVTSLDWGTYPLLTFADVPAIDVLMMPRPDDPPLGVGESASVPSAAAITNALFDATGVRFRELPLTPEKIRAALNPLPPPDAPPPIPAAKDWRRWRLPLGGVFAGMVATAAAVLPWQASIAPIQRPDASVFSAATLERGRLAAAVGACNICHVGVDGTAFAGGRALETPFGTIYAPNITPDPVAGIGTWSYPAFERAMRRGVSRDGHHLYPAHPYPSFTNASEADLQALYAYLMAQPASTTPSPQTTLAFPFKFRPLMAGWNALFLPKAAVPPEPARSAAWTRGAELVEGLGHCSACHSPRNAFGAEMRGADHLAGGFAEGWHAPALTAKSLAPVGWTEAAFYDYLRGGWSAEHGAAAGPMAQVIASLAPLPDSDIRAMATYLASFTETRQDADATAKKAMIASDEAVFAAAQISPKGARLFDGACASCHTNTSGLASLALSSSLHAPGPDNLLQAILHGRPAPQSARLPTGDSATEVTAMPAFRDTLSPSQIADLTRYLRARFAPDKPAWGAP